MAADSSADREGSIASPALHASSRFGALRKRAGDCGVERPEVREVGCGQLQRLGGADGWAVPGNHLRRCIVAEQLDQPSERGPIGSRVRDERKLDRREAIADSQHTQRAHAEADPVRRVTGQRNRLDDEWADLVSDARGEHAVDSRRARDLELVLSGSARDQLGRRATRDRLGGERPHGRNRIGNAAIPQT